MLLDTSPKATMVLVLSNDIIINPKESTCYTSERAVLVREVVKASPVGRSFACCNAAFHYNGVSTGSRRVL